MFRLVVSAVIAACFTLAPLVAEAVPGYGTSADLQQAIDRMQQADSLEKVSSGSLLKQGSSGERVHQLTQRLKAFGNLDEATRQYDQDVTDAVRAFQKRHGLKVDGLAGENTLAALNASADDKLRHMRASLERIKTFEEEADDEYVLVNVPDFHLVHVRDGGLNLEMDVIVGEAAWNTHTMRETIDSVALNPTWNIPVEIVAADLAPDVVENPNYLEENNMVVKEGSWADDAPTVDPSTIDWANVTEGNFDYYVQQKAGPENPLGQLKILFYNQHDIYLHDTPDEVLFKRADRSLSHGCIRMQKPFDLAAALLEGTDQWNRQKLVEATGKGADQQFIPVPGEVPVHLVYWTAWVDDEGQLQLREDIYDRDGNDDGSDESNTGQ